MKSTEVRAAVTEAGFEVKRSTLWEIRARHAGTGASLRAECDRLGIWRFTIIRAGGTYAITPRDIQELVYLLTTSFSADARKRVTQ